MTNVTPIRPGVGRQLTPAHIRVLTCAARGLSVAQTADELGCSAHTVRTHRRSIFRRLGASGVTQAVAIALERGLLGPPRPREPIGARQRSKLYAKIGELNELRKNDRAKAELMAAASLRAGCEFESLNDLSYEQASDAIDWIVAEIGAVEARHAKASAIPAES